jgi:hypothetical protein
VRSFGWVLLISCLFGVQTNLSAAIIKALPSAGGYDKLDIVIEGEIVKGDYEKFVNLVKQIEGYVDEVDIFTPGGDFFEAIKIGKAMRRLRMRVQAPLSGSCEGANLKTLLKDGYLTDQNNCTCTSAGFFIFVGGVYRYGQEIYIHRPYLTQKMLASLEGKDAALVADQLKSVSRIYLKEMDVPQNLIDHLWSTPANTVFRLPDDDSKTYFSGWIPEYEDWSNAKCPGEKNNWNCISDNLEALQRQAFKNEFGKFPDKIAKKHFKDNIDYETHQYDFWIYAKKYLGLPVSELRNMAYPNSDYSIIERPHLSTPDFVGGEPGVYMNISYENNIPGF